MTLREYQSFACRDMTSAYHGGDYRKQQELAVLSLVASIGDMCSDMRRYVEEGVTGLDKDAVSKNIGRTFLLCAKLIALHGLDIHEIAIEHLRSMKDENPELFDDFTKEGFTARKVPDGQAGT
jgi:hypothetical protein